jgi:putative transposase
LRKAADRTSVAQTVKKHKGSEQTIYSSREHFGGLQPADMTRLNSPEAERAEPLIALR